GSQRGSYIMTIRLPEELERFISAKEQSGQFASEDAAVAEAVRLLRQRDQEHAAEKERIESLLIAGLDSGPSTPMTSQDSDEIEQERRHLIASRNARTSRSTAL